MNLLFSYCYRDSGNNKKYGEVVFENRDNISPGVIDQQIRKLLLQEEFFVPKNWNIPSLSFDGFDPELDHEWHEYLSVEDTDRPSTIQKDISAFLSSLTNEETICP